jgi:hypothetical protein
MAARASFDEVLMWLSTRWLRAFRQTRKRGLGLGFGVWVLLVGVLATTDVAGAVLAAEA